MIRGTTPRHTFTLPFIPPEGTCFRIVYAQGEDYKEKILFELETDRCTIDGDKISVTLTAEETRLFDCTPHYCHGMYCIYPVKIQVGSRTPGDSVLWSNIIETTVDRCLREDGVV